MANWGDESDEEQKYVPDGIRYGSIEDIGRTFHCCTVCDNVVPRHRAVDGDDCAWCVAKWRSDLREGRIYKTQTRHLLIGRACCTGWLVAFALLSGLAYGAGEIGTAVVVAFAGYAVLAINLMRLNNVELGYE